VLNIVVTYFGGPTYTKIIIIKKNRKQRENAKNQKYTKRKSQKYIIKKNIPEYPGNYRRILVQKDQNIQD